MKILIEHLKSIVKNPPAGAFFGIPMGVALWALSSLILWAVREAVR